MNKKMIFAAVCCVAVLFTACEKKGMISISPFSKDVSATGETFQVQVTSTAAWTASPDQTWLTLSPASGTGDAAVTVTVAANTSTTADVAEAVFAISGVSVKLTVNRAGNNAGDGSFSVSSTKKVKFSQGNLQYQASTKTWRFAENQYDMIGTDNVKISSTYTGWIDLFGWGTSGYNNKYPYMDSTANPDYADGDVNDIAGTNYDWGVYNKISNGGNQANKWRTLTKDEWEYLFNTRAGAATKSSQATVNDINGLILLPDAWVLPDGLSFIAHANGYRLNMYSIAEWAKMEANGAVFLPAAGYRISHVTVYLSEGSYMSSSSDKDACCMYYVHFTSNSMSPINTSGRYAGRSVRLAQDL